MLPSSPSCPLITARQLIDYQKSLLRNDFCALFFLLLFYSISSAIEDAMPPKFGGKWGVEYHNTRLSLGILLLTQYRVKLKKKVIIVEDHKVKNITQL